jgi:uncharacterized protein YbaP (TraB family)
LWRVKTERSALRRIAFAGLVAASLGACATPPAPRESGLLVFWRIARADGGGGSAHLLGSMHVAKQALALDPAIGRALAEADELVLEVAPEEIGSPEVQELIVARGRLPQGRTLGDLVAPDTLAAVAEQLEERGLPLASWLGWEPWVVSLALASDQLESEGFRREQGVERTLAAEAAGARKPARGLETTSEQIERLDGLPLATQELLLRDAVLGPRRESPIDTLELAWQRGDLGALAREIFASPTGAHAAAYFEAIYFARNRRFAEAIAELVDAGGRWFVAVGAGHMVGDEGIPQLLAARGYRVERVPKSAPLAAAPEVSRP